MGEVHDMLSPIASPQPSFEHDQRSALSMTMREQIAAMAMQGILASGYGEGSSFSDFALRSVMQADALIAELAK